MWFGHIKRTREDGVSRIAGKAQMLDKAYVLK